MHQDICKKSTPYGQDQCITVFQRAARYPFVPRSALFLCTFSIFHSARWTFFMLRFFHAADFFVLYFLMLHFVHVALFLCCSFFMLHPFHVVFCLCCTIPIFRFFELHSFHVALFLCCTISMLHFFRVALFSCCTFFIVTLSS